MSLTKNIIRFERLKKIFPCFQFSVLTYSDLCQFEKSETTENLGNINFIGKQKMGAIFINHNCRLKYCYFNSTRKINLGRDFIRRKQYQLCCKLVEKLYVGLIEIQSLNITVLAYVKRLFASLKKKINVFKELIVSNVSGISFWVMGPIRRKRRDIKKILFQWQANKWNAIFKGQNWLFR